MVVVFDDLKQHTFWQHLLKSLKSHRLIFSAKAARADAYTIRHPNDFEQLDYHALCSRNGPTLLEVHIDPEEALPLGMI